MASSHKNDRDEVALRFSVFNVLKDGRIVLTKPEFIGQKIPPSDDLANGIKIKDVQISSNVSARVFLPRDTTTAIATTTTHVPSNKLPLLFYIHGGGFCMESAFSVVYTRYISHLVAHANVIAISVEYALFPTRPIPACYEDSWTAFQWVVSHDHSHGPDPWINDYADLRRIFIAGDSAGGNISHNLLVRLGSTTLPKGVYIEGMILTHPYFGIGRKSEAIWFYMCPTNEGYNDHRLKPTLEDLSRICCERVLVVLADKDTLYGGGKKYAEDLIKSEWKGTVEIVVNKDKHHCFHIYNVEDSEYVANIHSIASFIHRPYTTRHLFSSL